MKRNIVILCLCWIMQVDQIEPAYQDACIFENKFCLQAPTTWIRQDHYSKFADYTSVFDSRFISKDGGSQVTIKVTDKKYNPRKVGVQSILDTEKSDSLLWLHAEMIDSGIQMHESYEFGFFKSQFIYHKKKRYNILCFALDKEGYEYTVEISSLTLPAEKFKETADHIFQSLRLN